MTSGSFNAFEAALLLRDHCMECVNAHPLDDCQELYEASEELLAWVVDARATIAALQSAAGGASVRPLTGAERSARFRERHGSKHRKRNENATPSVTPSVTQAAPRKLSSESSSLETSAGEEEGSKESGNKQVLVKQLSSESSARTHARDACEAPVRNASATRNETNAVALRVTEQRARDDGADDRRAAWAAYACAYRARYGIDPVRNAKLNAQLKQLCSRIPLEDLVGTITHYVRSENARYVGAGHSVGCLLQDAEKLRTEALTGRHGTVAGARRVDREADTGGQYRDLVARLDAEAAANANGRVIHGSE